MQSACRCFGRSVKGPLSPYFSYPKGKKNPSDPREVLCGHSIPACTALCVPVLWKVPGGPLEPVIWVGPPEGILLPPSAQILHGSQGHGFNEV